MNLPIFSLQVKNTTQDRVESLLQYQSSLLSHRTRFSAPVRFALARPHSGVWQFLQKWLQKKPAFYFALFAGLICLLPAETSFAATPSPLLRTFLATAYYSPLPNQENYYRGTYEADIRLNGKGSHGADGTPVFAGMIAAPKGYDFGTKIALDGIGIVSVHDRGGAIVTASDGGHAYDRIDIWMGYGDEGLARTRAWGKREILGRIVDSSLTPSIDLATIIENAPNTLDIALKKFAVLGYVPENNDTKSMIQRFQLDYKVIADASDPGAGTYGPRTRSALARAYAERVKSGEIVDASLPGATSLDAPSGDILTGDMPTVHTDAARMHAEKIATHHIGEASDGVRHLQAFLSER